MKITHLISITLAISTICTSVIATPSMVQPITATVKAPKYRYIKIAKGYTVANLYSKDSNKSIVLKVFKGGEKVKELDKNGSMLKVEYDGVSGWIMLR